MPDEPIENPDMKFSGPTSALRTNCPCSICAPHEGHFIPQWSFIFSGERCGSGALSSVACLRLVRGSELQGIHHATAGLLVEIWEFGTQMEASGFIERPCGTKSCFSKQVHEPDWSLNLLGKALHISKRRFQKPCPQTMATLIFIEDPELSDLDAVSSGIAPDELASDLTFGIDQSYGTPAVNIAAIVIGHVFGSVHNIYLEVSYHLFHL